MAIGVPVLVTDNSSNREWVIEGESGYLFRSDSTFSLVEKIIQVANLDSNEVIKIARKIINTKADWEINSSRIIRTIKEILKQGGN